jgi:hypothetical protein
VIVRDVNGDAWVAWSSFSDGMFFAHTYTIATTSTPTVTTSGSDRTLHWTLSELAPETWWAVLAARDGGPCEEVARVRAADVLEMSWTDTSAPANEIRYKIRRESVDTRYQWLSDEVVWDGTTPVALSLLNADATAERVMLTWQGTGAGALEATVERRTETTDWQAIGAALAAGPDRLRFEDSTVVPGTRHGYRLAYVEGGETRLTTPAWVEVPERFALALEGFQPNPARSGANIAFTLPSSGRLQLEVVDVTGRRVFRKRLDDLGAGRHTVRLDAGRALAPGVYLIRLTHGGRTITARGVIVQ